MPLDSAYFRQFRHFSENVEFSENDMATIGSIGQFDSAEESWQSYVERFELFVDCNGISEAKKLSTLLTVMGVRTYSLLKDLITPNKPSEKTYKEIIDTISQHLHPKPSFITERFKFSRRNQLDHETVSEYLVQLKQLSKYCEFGDKLPDYLRDRLVAGLKDPQIQKRLLGEENLTYDKAVQTATAMEFAERGAATIHHGGGRIHNLHSRAPSNAKQLQSTNSGAQRVASDSGRAPDYTCFCCGRRGHSKPHCRYREYDCNRCHRKGHIARVCRSKNFERANEGNNMKNDVLNQFHDMSIKGKTFYNSRKQFPNQGKHFNKNKHHYVGECNDSVNSKTS